VPALPREIASGHLRLAANVTADRWLPARIAYYPLWRATADGSPVATRRGEMGDLEVQSPRPGAEIDLVYTRGPAETAGIAVTALSLAALALVALFRVRPTDRN
jgi:hypothetical protein